MRVKCTSLMNNSQLLKHSKQSWTILRISNTSALTADFCSFTNSSVNHLSRDLQDYPLLGSGISSFFSNNIIPKFFFLP